MARRHQLKRIKYARYQAIIELRKRRANRKFVPQHLLSEMILPGLEEFRRRRFEVCRQCAG